MTNMKIDNIIGGKDINLSKQYFKVKSQFYKNFELEISDSNDMEVSIAISKVKQSWEETQQLSFNDRIRIINSATKELNFTKDEIDSIVKLIGMPITYIKEQINQIPIIMNGMWSIISNRYGFKYGKLGLDFIEDKNFHKIEFRTPRKGFVYAITPGNDPRITSLVITILVLLGIPGIIKPSKTDSIIPQKIVRKIIDAGYPKNSLALLFFNSEKEDSKKLHFKICDEANIIWPFGDDETVNNLIRFEEKRVLNFNKFVKYSIDNPNESINEFINKINKINSMDDYLINYRIDHFSSKTIIKHTSGKCAGLLDTDFDLNKAAKLILDSSMKYPIGCNSMKSVFVVETIFNKFVDILKEEMKKIEKYTYDPLDQKTKVGYTDQKTVIFLKKRLDELKRLNLISILCGGKFISNIQITPTLVSTNDISSELLINEIPSYILCLNKVSSFNEGVDRINQISRNNPKLAVSYFTNNLENMKLQVNAHHLKINYLTTEIDVIIHEGNDYIMQLTKPYVVNINKIGLKGHPYR